MKTPIEIDFLDFFKTGLFNVLKLGQTKEWILNNFPVPDDRFDVEMQKDGFDIWTYGGLELHFENNILFLIYSDCLVDLNGGDKLNLNKWIFNDLSFLNLKYTLTQLKEENIDYKRLRDSLGVVLRLQSGIELTFEDMSDDDYPISDNFKLTSFGLIAENPIRWNRN